MGFYVALLWGFWWKVEFLLWIFMLEMFQWRSMTHILWNIQNIHDGFFQFLNIRERSTRSSAVDRSSFSHSQISTSCWWIKNIFEIFSSFKVNKNIHKSQPTRMTINQTHYQMHLARNRLRQTVCWAPFYLSRPFRKAGLGARLLLTEISFLHFPPLRSNRVKITSYMTQIHTANNNNGAIGR